MHLARGLSFFLLGAAILLTVSGASHAAGEDDGHDGRIEPSG